MRTLALTLTVALGLTSALQAQDNLSFQEPDVRLWGRVGVGGPGLSPPYPRRPASRGQEGDVV